MSNCFVKNLLTNINKNILGYKFFLEKTNNK